MDHADWRVTLPVATSVKLLSTAGGRPVPAARVIEVNVLRPSDLDTPRQIYRHRPRYYVMSGLGHKRREIC